MIKWALGRIVFLVTVASVVLDAINLSRKSDRFDKAQITRCAQIQKVKNTGLSLELVLDIKTGGKYHDGCVEEVILAYIPLPGQEFDLRKHAGERCVSNMGASLKFREGGIVYDSELHCQQVGYGSHSQFVAEPIILEVNFDSPVYERELELHHIAHKGDPHADSIPFMSGAFKADANFVDPEFFTDPPFDVPNYDNIFNRPPLVYSPEEPLCTQFAFPDGPAHIPDVFNLMDKREVENLFSPSFVTGQRPIATFSHNYELTEDIFSIGGTLSTGGIPHDAGYQMNWKKPPPLSPFMMVNTNKLLATMVKLQLFSQIEGGGYEYPRDWYDFSAIAEQGFDQVQTYLSPVPIADEDGTCGISFELLGKSITILRTIRSSLGYGELSNIADLARQMNISQYELINFERHLENILDRLAVFVGTTKISMPALVSVIDRINGSPLTGMRADASITTSCEFRDRISPLTCITPNIWKSIFGINPVNGYTQSVSDLVSDISTMWGPVLCSAFPDSNKGEKCLSVNQFSCGRNREELKRRVITNQQSHNPSCKIWKPVKKSLGEAIVSGTIKSIKGGFSMMFSQTRIKNRMGRHSSTFREISNSINFRKTFDLSKSGGTGMGTSQYSRAISGTLHTKYTSLSLSQHLMEPSSSFYILQCGDLYSHRDYDGYSISENPYARHCINNNITQRFFPFTNESRGCTPLDLDSQKNFLFLSKGHAQKGALGTGCGAMNFNTAETGGSTLREIEQRFGNKNLNSVGLDSTDGFAREDLHPYLTTNHLCAPGQNCVRTSPCRMYGEMVAWGGRIDGLVGEISAGHAIEESIINARQQTNECFYGGSGLNPSLPPVVTELTIAITELTRSTYKSYEFVKQKRKRPITNPRFDSEQIATGDLPPNLLRDYINSITVNKQFCSSVTGAGYPEVLSMIMNPFTESLYHPIAWIYTPETSFTDGPVHNGETYKLRNNHHGKPLSVHYFGGTPPPAPSPSPFPTPPITPIPSPYPTPITTPTPTPTSQRVDQKQTVNHHHLFYKHQLDAAGQFSGEAVSFEAHLSIPLPTSVRELHIANNKMSLIHRRSALHRANSAACISVDSATSVLKKYPLVQDPTLLPLMGTVAYDSTLDNMHPLGTPIQLFLSILCLPFQANSICYDVNIRESFVLDSCHYPKQISVVQEYISKSFAESLLAETIASGEYGGDIGGRDTFGPLTSSIISKGRMIRVNWTQTQSPDDIFRWAIGLQRQRTAPNGEVETNFHYNSIKSVMFQAMLSVHSPEVIVSQFQPFYGADDIQIVRYIGKNSERAPTDPMTCLYDSTFCKGIVRDIPLSPSPSPATSPPISPPSPFPVFTPSSVPSPVTTTPITVPNPSPTPTPGSTNSSGDNNATGCGSSIHDIGCDFHNGTIKSNAWFWVFLLLGLVLATILIYFIIKCVRQREADKSESMKRRNVSGGKKND
jgi:hypothetical protein